MLRLPLIARSALRVHAPRPSPLVSCMLVDARAGVPASLRPARSFASQPSTEPHTAHTAHSRKHNTHDAANNTRHMIAKDAQTRHNEAHTSAAGESAAQPAPADATQPPPHSHVPPTPPPIPELVPPKLAHPPPPPVLPGFNAAAAAAAAALTGVPPVAPDTVVEVIAVPAEPDSTNIVQPSTSPCPPSPAAGATVSAAGAASAAPKRLLSQSPPAGLPLPFTRTHLVWMANGEQSSIDELFFTPKPVDAVAAPQTAPASQPEASPATNLTAPAATQAGTDGPAPSAAVAAVTPAVAPAAAAAASVVPPPRPRTVVVVGFVGAFLSLCQEQLPPFSRRWTEFRARGVDSVLAVSVNDHAVLKSFAQQAQIDLAHIGLIADHDASFVRALHLALDLSAAGMGWRAKRFVLVVREGHVAECWVEDNPGELTVSSAESVLARMPVLPECDEAAIAARRKKDKKAAASAKADASDSEAAATVAIPLPASPAAPAAVPSASAPSSAAASAAATVVAAVRGLSAAVSDRLDGTTAAADAIASAARADSKPAADASASDKPDGDSTDAETEEAARRAAAEQTPPGQA